MRRAVALAGGAIGLAAVAAVWATAAFLHRTTSLTSLGPGLAIVSSDTGRLITRVPGRAIPVPGDVVTGNGSFWAWSLDPFTLLQIGDDGRIHRRVESPFEGDTGWFLPDGRDVWFTGDEQLARVSANGTRVTRLSPSHRRLATGWVARCAGSLWVADNQASRLLRVTLSGRIVARVRTPYPWAVACGDGGLWVTSNGARGARRIDTARNVVTATAPTPPSFSLAVGGGYAWTADATSGTVRQVGRGGRIVAAYATGPGAGRMSFGGGRLWVANEDAGSVTGIDPATRRTVTYRFAHPVQGIAALGSRLLVALTDGPTAEGLIRQLRGDVARLIVPLHALDEADPALATGPWMRTVEQASCATISDVATGPPRVSAGGRVYAFTIRSGARFAPPSNAPVTVADVRSSIERAISWQLAVSVPGYRHLTDIVGAHDLNSGAARHATGIGVSGNTITFTLRRPSSTFVQRLDLPFFCVVPAATSRAAGGVDLAPPSAAPYYMSDRLRGAYVILKRNPNYAGPHPARLDAVAFWLSGSPETASAKTAGDGWQVVRQPQLPDDLYR